MKNLLSAIAILALIPAVAAADQAPAVTPPATTAPAAAPAVAPTAAPAAAAPVVGPTATLATSAEAQKKREGFRMGVGLDHSIGQGLIERGEMLGSGSIAGSLSLSPSYSFDLAGMKMGASANVGLSYEYTRPDSSTARRYNWGDIGLGLSAPAIYKNELTGISVSPRVGLTLPVSMGSLFRGTITNMSGGVALGRSFGKVNVGLNLGASKTFYGEITRNIKQQEIDRRDGLGNALFLCRTDSDNCGLRGVPNLWAMNAGLNANYSPVDKLNLGISFSMGKSMDYYIGVDENSSTKLDSNGNPVVKAQGTSDRMMGALSASYQLTSAIGISASMQTAQTPFSADNQRLRFPFYAFEGQENSLTAYSLALSAAF